MLSHFKRNRRIICDASEQERDAVLQQKENKSWNPVLRESTHLYSKKKFGAKNSYKELELLAEVSSIEHFKNYVYGTAFGVVSDNKSFKERFLKATKSNWPFSKFLLTRWVDGFLLFEFSIVHTPGRTPGRPTIYPVPSRGYFLNQRKCLMTCSSWT